MIDTIHCIGDSHVSFFSGRNSLQPAWPLHVNDIIPSFRTYRLGAVLAYSLVSLNTTMQGREKLFELLKEIPRGSSVIMCFGEIDCRVHLVKQSEKQNRPLKNVVVECVDRYFGVLKEIKKDFKVIAWAVIPSTPSEIILDPRYPHFGTNMERNAASKFFNERLALLCQKEGITFLSIFDKLVNPDGSTNDRFLVDKVHLSQKAMPLTIKQLGKILPELPIRLYKNRTMSSLPFRVQLMLFTSVCEIKTTVYSFFILSKIRAKKTLNNILGENLSQKIRSVLYHCG